MGAGKPIKVKMKIVKGKMQSHRKNHFELCIFHFSFCIA